MASAADAVADTNLIELANKWSVQSHNESIHYDDAIKIFFDKWGKYSKAESKRMTQNRMKIRSYNADILSGIKVPKPDLKESQCIACKAAGGTEFIIRADRYEARCSAHDKRCKFHILIKRGQITSLPAVIKSDEQNMNKITEKVIRLKLDTLFDLVDEEESQKRFKKLMDLYHQYNSYCDYFKKIYSDVILMPAEKRAQIEAVRRDIDQYIFDIQTLLGAAEPAVADAAAIYHGLLAPKLEQLQDLLYEICELDFYDGADPPTARLEKMEVWPASAEIWVREDDKSEVRILQNTK